MNRTSSNASDMYSVVEPPLPTKIFRGIPQPLHANTDIASPYKEAGWRFGLVFEKCSIRNLSRTLAAMIYVCRGPCHSSGG
jgi:hypothetical protein